MEHNWIPFNLIVLISYLGYVSSNRMPLSYWLSLKGIENVHKYSLQLCIFIAQVPEGAYYRLPYLKSISISDMPGIIAMI